MLFNSFAFLVFFPTAIAGYFALPHRVRWLWLLIASCVFYMAFVPAYLLILALTIVVDYIAGIVIERSTGKKRLAWLVVSILSNVSILAVFKYARFAVENVNAVFSLVGAGTAFKLPEFLLPIGLSFHTFQAMAYTIEVYRGKQQAERHFGIYALYVMYFPQLVAGPIERPQNILPQLKVERRFEYDNMVRGLLLMAWGMFMKVVIADRLARIVNPIFDNMHENHGLVLLIGAVAFTWQIYFDFAGYSTIARGAARVMGIELMVNFKSPYHGTSIRDFWTRWHISLSTWFRDYLYIPLGGNRVSRVRWYFNLWFVFLVSGFWHGASWNFIVWGALHGTYLVVALLVDPYMPAVLKDNSRPLVPAFNVFQVFLLPSVAFVFFRAATLGDAVYLLRHIPTGLGGDLGELAKGHVTSLFHDRGLPPVRDWAIAGLGLLVTQIVEIGQRDGSMRDRLGAWPAWIRWPAYCALTYSIVCFASSEPAQFIYFQF